MIYPHADTRLFDYRREVNALPLLVGAAILNVLDLTFAKPIKAGDHLDMVYQVEAEGGEAGGTLDLTASVIAPATFTLLEPDHHTIALVSGKTGIINCWVRGLCLEGGSPFRVKIDGSCSAGDVLIAANGARGYAFVWRP